MAEKRKYEKKRSMSGLNDKEVERVEEAYREKPILKNAIAAADATARAKNYLSEKQYGLAHLNEQAAEREDKKVEEEARQKSTKKVAAQAVKKEARAVKKLAAVVNHEPAKKGGAKKREREEEREEEEEEEEDQDTEPEGELAGGELEGGEIAGGELEGGELEGGELEGGELEGGAGKITDKKREAIKAVGKAKTAAKKTEHNVIREVAKVHVGHDKKTKERRAKSREARRSRSPEKKERESPKRDLPESFTKWTRARAEYFKDHEKQAGVLRKGTPEYEGVRRIYEKM